MTTRPELRSVAGRVMMVGLEGLALTPVERAWLRLIRPSGVILFRRNIESAEQTVEMFREATEVVGRSLIRAVDMEGGLVDRLRDYLGPTPSPADVYGTRNPDLYFRHGELIGRAAHMMGFNTVFAPVLDLALPESKPVLRSRVISPRPSDVVHYASAFLSGLSQQEVFGCGKHFPGLGAGALDSHQTMPVIESGWMRMWQQDLVPFRDLAHALPMVMVAHAAYPGVTRRPIPASLSAHWITRVLRKRIRYQGLVVSDDMEMGGILEHFGVGDACVRAIAAGTDLVEICKDPALILDAYETMLRRAEIDGDFARGLRAAARRLERWSERSVLIQTRRLRSPNPPRVEKLRAEIAHFREICS